MQDDKEALERLINEYLRGTIGPEEKQHLEKWMDSLDLSEGQPAPREFHKALMKKQIDRRTGMAADVIEIRRHNLWRPIAAASLLFLLGISVYLWQAAPREALYEQRAADSPSSGFYEVINNSGKDTLFALKDGSKVLLSAGSSLTWPADFAVDARELTLDGKAFFQVTKDPERPFSVYSGDIVTTALGTSFWVEKVKDRRSPRVRLITGKVSIRQQLKNGRDTLLAMLTPGEEWQMSTFKPTVAPSVGNDRKQEKTVPSTASVLVFHHTPLQDVLPRLADYYRVAIKFDIDELKGMSFYGTYDSENRIADILQTIALANDLTVEYNEKEATYTVKK